MSREARVFVGVLAVILVLVGVWALADAPNVSNIDLQTGAGNTKAGTIAEAMIDSVDRENELERTEQSSPATTEKDSRRLTVDVLLALPSRKFLPAASARVEVWVRDSSSTAIQYSVTTADGVGRAHCPIPPIGGFTLKGFADDVSGRIDGLRGSAELSDEEASRITPTFPESLPLQIWAERASIEASVSILGGNSGEGVWVHVSDSLSEQVVILGERENTKFVRSGTDSGRVNFEVVPGAIYFCSICDLSGKVLKTVASDGQLAPGQIWKLDVSVDLEEWWREFFFVLETESQDVRTSILAVSLFDVGTGQKILSETLGFAPGRVYSIRIPRGKESIFVVDSPGIGRTSGEILPTSGLQRDSPYSVIVPLPSSLMFRATSFPGLAEGAISACLTFPGEGPALARFHQSREESGLFELADPLSMDLLGVRVGDRLFRSNLTSGHRYFLSDPEFLEVEIPEVVSVNIEVSTFASPGSHHVMDFYFDGLAWTSQVVRQPGAHIVQTQVRLPIGKLRFALVTQGVRVWHSFEVTGEGAQIKLP